MQILRQSQSSSRFFAILALALLGLIAVSWWSAAPRYTPAQLLVQDFFPKTAFRTASSTDRTVERLQSILRAEPEDWQAYSQLGLAYLQKARETGDPTYYQKAEAALEKALAKEPGDYVAVSAMGALALARHQFQDAQVWGERAREINPDRPYAYGVIADAQIELGQYDQAVQILQAMVDLRPDMSSYARVSYLRELYGDTKGALELMQWAVDSGVPNHENTAWTRTQLGNLYFNLGDLEHAEAEYQRTLVDYPDYMYAIAGLGRVRVAQGRVDEGLASLTQASQRIPIPEFIIALADVYEMAGQEEMTQKQVDLLRVIQQLYQANGVDMDLEIALFNADHELDLDATLVLASQGYQRRPSIYAADVLAWTLYKTGHYEQARVYADQALRLGTRDALKLFHSGMIHYRLGNTAQALRDLELAIATNPYFSVLYAEEAVRMLDELRAAASGQ